LGIQTAGDLAAAEPGALEDRFGYRGRELHDRARGVDDREVTPTGRPKSLSRESAFAEATDDEAEKREIVTALAADVAERARSRGAMYRTIGIKVVVPPYDVNTRAQSLSGPVDDPELVREVAVDLLSEFDDEAARKVGVRVSNLSFADADQSSLDGWEGAADGETESPPSDARAAESSATESADDATADGTDDARRHGSENARGTGSDGQVSLGDFD